MHISGRINQKLQCVYRRCILSHLTTICAQLISTVDH